ncbi:MAG: GNAT family N-acetyltransferase [Bacteroidota bacterium]|jgi:predicted GNAT family N-acyltransferase
MVEIKEIQPSDTWDLRHRVMWADKPLSYVQLLEDENGNHFGVLRDGKILSVISLFVENDTAQFRKFATEISEQGKGFGSILLKHIIEESSKRKIKTLWCNARLTAYEFYQKFGFKIVSEMWLKDGLEYVKMAKDL